MMAGFGLGTRRFIAAGLAVLTLLLAMQLLVTPLLSVISELRDELALLKVREARLTAARNWPSRPDGDVAIGALLVSGSEAEAREALSERLTGMAATEGLVEPSVGVSAERGDDAIAYAITLSVSGPHDAVLRFLAEVEGGRPLLRVRTLSLVPVPQREGELAAEMQLDAIGRGR